MMHALVKESLEVFYAFLLQKKRQQIITYRAPFPPSLGSCNACLLERSFQHFFFFLAVLSISSFTAT